MKNERICSKVNDKLTLPNMVASRSWRHYFACDGLTTMSRKRDDSSFTNVPKTLGQITNLRKENSELVL